MKVFISHIHEDKSIASKLKEWIEESFLGQIDVFVSSFPNEITLGNKWLNDVEENIIDASIILILANEISLTRGWIYFEAGAGWNKKIPLISICFGQLNKGNLPSPFSFFQGANVTDEDFSKNLFTAISEHCNFKNPPNIDYSKMDEEILELISETQLEGMGYVDHIIEMEDNFNEIGSIFMSFAEEMERVRIETEDFSSEITKINIDPKAYDARRAQTLARKLAKTYKNFVIQLSNSNNEYAVLTERSQENINFIFEYPRQGTLKEKFEIEKLKPMFDFVLTQALDTRTAIESLGNDMNQIPKFERHLKKELIACGNELSRLGENLSENIILFRKTISKIEDVLKEYETCA